MRTIVASWPVSRRTVRWTCVERSGRSSTAAAIRRSGSCATASGSPDERPTGRRRSTCAKKRRRRSPNRGRGRRHGPVPARPPPARRSSPRHGGPGRRSPSTPRLLSSGCWTSPPSWSGAYPLVRRTGAPDARLPDDPHGPAAAGPATRRPGPESDGDGDDPRLRRCLAGDSASRLRDPARRWACASAQRARNSRHSPTSSSTRWASNGGGPSCIRRIGGREAAIEALMNRGPAEASERLMTIPGIGPWTAAETTRLAFGDPDAVSVGDAHIPDMVAWALAERASRGRRPNARTARTVPGPAWPCRGAAGSGRDQDSALRTPVLTPANRTDLASWAHGTAESWTSDSAADPTPQQPAR